MIKLPTYSDQKTVKPFLISGLLSLVSHGFFLLCILLLAEVVFEKHRSTFLGTGATNTIGVVGKNVPGTPKTTGFRQSGEISFSAPKAQYESSIDTAPKVLQVKSSLEQQFTKKMTQPESRQAPKPAREAIQQVPPRPVQPLDQKATPAYTAQKKNTAPALDFASEHEARKPVSVAKDMPSFAQNMAQTSKSPTGKIFTDSLRSKDAGEEDIEARNLTGDVGHTILENSDAGKEGSGGIGAYGSGGSSQDALAYLRSLLKLYEDYPEHVREKKVEGVVRVKVSISKSGALLLLEPMGDAPPELIAITEKTLKRVKENWQAQRVDKTINVIVPVQYTLQKKIL